MGLMGRRHFFEVSPRLISSKASSSLAKGLLQCVLFLLFLFALGVFIKIWLPGSHLSSRILSGSPS